mmetsp:Transcript_31271/g.45770  ORF Transcript_31271/g.45770 Transcript_31271/m.45770 type:complete len:117 (+) Transcript_31271:65-415(+)
MELTNQLQCSTAPTVLNSVGSEPSQCANYYICIISSGNNEHDNQLVDEYTMNDIQVKDENIHYFSHTLVTIDDIVTIATRHNYKFRIYSREIVPKKMKEFEHPMLPAEITNDPLHT